MNRYIYTGLLATLLLGWSCLLTNCTDHTENDIDRPDTQSGEPLRVAGLTRGEGDELTPVPDPRMSDIKLFLVSQSNLSDKTEGTVTYQGKDTDTGDLIWDAGPLKVKPGKDYYLFGFLPADITTEASSVAVVDAANATMTIEDIPMVTNQDICMVTGVKAGKVTDGSVPLGSFAYHAPENTDLGYEVSLRADHLYGAVEFRIKIDKDYNKVRTIKLKSLKLKSKKKSTLQVEASLAMNDDGNQPLSDIVYDTNDIESEPEILLFEKTEGKELDVDNPITITGYFAAGMIGEGENRKEISSYLYLECEYEVLDKSGKHTIEDRIAKNSLASVLSGLPRGRMKKVNLIVDPTYLYVLSGWDVDDPQ